MITRRPGWVVGSPAASVTRHASLAMRVTATLTLFCRQGESGSTVFTPGLHAEPAPLHAHSPTPLQAHSPTPSRTTYTKGESHTNSSDHINGRRHQRLPTVSAHRPVAAQLSDYDPAWQEKYGQAAGRPWIIAALVVCILIVVGIGMYFILQQANVVD